jgi:hypothetical protein
MLLALAGTTTWGVNVYTTISFEGALYNLLCFVKKMQLR